MRRSSDAETVSQQPDRADAAEMIRPRQHGGEGHEPWSEAARRSLRRPGALGRLATEVTFMTLERVLGDFERHRRQLHDLLAPNAHRLALGFEGFMTTATGGGMASHAAAALDRRKTRSSTDQRPPPKTAKTSSKNSTSPANSMPWPPLKSPSVQCT